MMEEAPGPLDNPRNPTYVGIIVIEAVVIALLALLGMLFA